MLELAKVFTKGKSMWPVHLLKNGNISARLLWLGLLGVILLILGSFWENDAVQIPEKQLPDMKAPASVKTESYEEILADKLSGLLSRIQGAGEVAVTITLENGSTQEHAKNITKESRTISEKDTAGGIRTTTETKESEQVLLTKDNGTDKPVVVREIKPVVKGVLVVAEGAYDSAVKANLMKAVEAGLGIPAHKITVLPQKR
ncbi:putative membrane protein [Propionispora sp. 2/2-37]|uniref:hypothetical protein n=1 Tax=Propionispora sp. 2/2-37 TaxID=1677858 RepID=UPI0006BB60C8|nr:hypothetical protein [Propionispora sp. 2/2-37]CUH97439.1 putative membrane protein [Propionispora sp. 2/2-37]